MTTGKTAFREHHVRVDGGTVYARDYAGAEPAFVMMHGFPDNLHIYDDLVPLLVVAGRRVITFDFLGFGQSDKPTSARYSFFQQLGDLHAVVEHLGLERFVPVSHDAAGPAALNFALAYPERIASLVILNSAYAELPGAEWPELITIFATPALRDYAVGLIADLPQFTWLINFQRNKFRAHLPKRYWAHYDGFLNPVIDANFQGGAVPAFTQMTADFFPELQRNRNRLHELRALRVPARVIWGDADPYLGIELARAFTDSLAAATLTVLPGGHWVQIDEPRAVAQAMLSDV